MAAAIATFYETAKRPLPWRQTRDAYAIWISEIMCQQTKVATAIPYWQRFMARFPTVTRLAEAPLDDVLSSWAGLGYYTRARNLHRGAQYVVASEGGTLPSTASDLLSVPGIGAYTSAAIASIAYGEPAAVVDGNVARVVTRLIGLKDDVKSRAGAARVAAFADELMAARPSSVSPGDLNQGLMELGALVCIPKTPRCNECLCAALCSANKTGRQHELPVLPARRRTEDLPELHSVALWIVDDSANILLARRKPEGLFGGLWEFPNAQSLAGNVAVEATPLANHTQVLSHRRLQVVLHRARVTGHARLGNPGVSSYDALAWYTPSEASALGLARSTASLLSKLDRPTQPNETRWTSTPKSSRSSPTVSKKSSPVSASSATKPTKPTLARRRAAQSKASTSSAADKAASRKK